MANRYQYQFQGGMKPKMTNIEGFVSIGTGGLPNSVVGISSGGVLAASGTYFGTLPGCATAGVPTGWNGTFSGAIGLYGAGVDGIARIGTGLYSVHLSDDFVRLDSCQVEPVLGANALSNGGATGVDSFAAQVVYHTVGLGNTVTTGFMGASGLVGENLKNQILIQFCAAATPTVASDLPLSAGFFIQLRLRDSFAGPQ